MRQWCGWRHQIVPQAMETFTSKGPPYNVSQRVLGWSPPTWVFLVKRFGNGAPSNETLQFAYISYSKEVVVEIEKQEHHQDYQKKFNFTDVTSAKDMIIDTDWGCPAHSHSPSTHAGGGRPATVPCRFDSRPGSLCRRIYGKSNFTCFKIMKNLEHQAL